MPGVSSPQAKRTFLVISQVYVPDPASLGQHVADAAAEMARRGYRVIVYTSARGYDDPAKVYPRRETLNGVDVRRLALSSFGKSSIAVRLLAQSLFVVQAVLRGLFTRNLCGILVSTSPPFCGVAGVLISVWRRIPLKYWLMDLNPDQMIGRSESVRFEFGGQMPLLLVSPSTVSSFWGRVFFKGSKSKSGNMSLSSRGLRQRRTLQ